MGSQITKIPSICGDSYPGVGYQVDDGEAVRVAMAWPSASAGGWRSLTMEVPKKLSLETEFKGVSVETLLKAAGQLFGDNDLDGFKQLEQMLGEKLPSAVVRAFARYAPVDSTHAGSAEKCRCEIEQFLGGDIPELDLEGMDNTSGKIQAVLVPVGFDPVAIEIDGTRDIMSHVGGIIDEASGYLPPDALPFNLSMYVNDEGLYSCQPNRAFYATESMEHEGYYSAIDGKPVVSGLPSSLLFGKEVIDEALEEFDDFCDWASGTELEYIGAYGTVSNDIKQAIAKYQDAVGKSGSEHDAGSDVPERSEAIQSLDEIIEQASEAAVDNEIGDKMSISNGER